MGGRAHRRGQLRLMWVKLDGGGGPLDVQQVHSVLPKDSPLAEINALATATTAVPTVNGDFAGGLSFAGGYTDWRLPTILELMTLIALTADGCGNGGPCIHQVFDNNCSA